MSQPQKILKLSNILKMFEILKLLMKTGLDTCLSGFFFLSKTKVKVFGIKVQRSNRLLVKVIT